MSILAVVKQIITRFKNQPDGIAGLNSEGKLSTDVIPDGIGGGGGGGSVNLSTSATGTLQAAQFPALTGAVTTTAGSVATTLANGSVTLAKMSDIGSYAILGNNSGSAATPTELSASQVKTMLAISAGDVSGLGSAAAASTATLLARTNHTGTQSADTIVNGTTNKAYTAAEQTKLAGIAEGATASVGTVTDISVIGNNGITVDIINNSTTPEITLNLEDINPTTLTTADSLTAGGNSMFYGDILLDSPAVLSWAGGASLYDVANTFYIEAGTINLYSTTGVNLQGGNVTVDNTLFLGTESVNNRLKQLRTFHKINSYLFPVNLLSTFAANITPSNGFLYLAAISVTKGYTYDRMGVYCNWTNTAVGNWRIGLWTVDEAYGLTLVTDGGQTAFGASYGGVWEKTISFSPTFTGVVYVGILISITSGSFGQLYGGSGSSAGVISSIGTNYAAGGFGVSGQSTGTALGDVAASSLVTTSAIPAVYLRRSA